MAEDGILAGEAIDGVMDAVVVEDYPRLLEGTLYACALHVVWGIPRGQVSPAVLVTAYRPDPAVRTDDFLRRRQ